MGFYTAEDSTLYYLTSNTSNRMGWEVTVAIDCNQYEVTKQNVVTTNVFLIVHRLF